MSKKKVGIGACFSPDVPMRYGHGSNPPPIGRSSLAERGPWRWKNAEKGRGKAYKGSVSGCGSRPKQRFRTTHEAVPKKGGETPESTCENHHSHYWFGWFLLQCPNVNAPFLDSAWLTWVHSASSRLNRHTLGPGLLFTFTIRNPSIFWGVKNNDDIPMASL